MVILQNLPSNCDFHSLVIVLAHTLQCTEKMTWPLALPFFILLPEHTGYFLRFFAFGIVIKSFPGFYAQLASHHHVDQ